MRRLTWAAILTASFAVHGGSSAGATTLTSIGDFDRPIFITSDPDDADRLLVVERPGLVLEATPSGTSTLADLTSLVSCCSGERGLLSIAPAADFSSSGRFYAAYTGKAAAGGAEGDVHVDSFRPDAQSGGPLVREPILTVGHSQFANHNGGQLQLGPDGYLYLSTGDGGGGGDPLGSGQDVEALLGKILRIDPRPGQQPVYAIPPGNPFVGQLGRDEIWAYGLRNPWRFSFDQASGDMVIADVGQGAREEVDYARGPGGVVSGGGANYGWNCREGSIAYSGAPAACTSMSGFADPIFDYPHSDPGGGAAHGCSITGGYVVRDLSLGDLYGRYVYADYCEGEVRSLQLPGSSSGLATGDRDEGLAVANPTSFGEDSCRRLYVASNAGAVYRLTGNSAAICARPTTQASTGVVKRAGALRLRLFAALLRPGTERFRITARLSPCGGSTGRVVRLKRGGRRIAGKRLDHHCLARFRSRVAHRSTFRAVLSSNAEDAGARSPRLAIEPGARQRSQVRTIALAKPRP